MNAQEIKKRLTAKLAKYRKEKGWTQYPQLRMNNQQMKKNTGTINGGHFGSMEEAQEVIDYLKGSFDELGVSNAGVETVSGFDSAYQIRFYYTGQEV